LTGTRLVFVALKVRDLEASTRFYRDVIGVPLEHAYTEPAGMPDPDWLGGYHSEYSWRDGAYLHLALFPASAGQETKGARIGFFTTDLGSLEERARRAAVRALSDAGDEPWGRTIAYADPDGNVVTVTERTHEDVADP
jgi:catechol 2,3-dioxygenase-like lactoylglutathione lyase family enzyme